MKCDLNFLEDYVEGFLKEMEQKEVEAHLQSCKNCQLEYEQLLNEQNVLFEQLNKSRMASSQTDAIMQHIEKNAKRKKSWQTLKMTVISAAIIMLSVALYYWNGPPNEVAQPLDEPAQLIEMTSSEQEEPVEVEQLLEYNEPFLDVSIDSVVENGENYDIYYRVKFKEPYQKEQNNLYEQLLRKYQYKEVANVPRAEDGQDDFFGNVRTSVRIAIRDKDGQLIAGGSGNEEPLLPTFSSSGDGTEILGESIFTTSVPKYTNPSTLEVLQMEADVFDLFETEINTAKPQPFQFKNAQYTIDSIEINKSTLQLKISTSGEPKNRPFAWDIDMNGRLISFNNATTNTINGRTVYELKFENFEQIPVNFKLLPLTVRVKNQIDPIVLDLH